MRVLSEEGKDFYKQIWAPALMFASACLLRWLMIPAGEYVGTDTVTIQEVVDTFDVISSMYILLIGVIFGSKLIFALSDWWWATKDKAALHHAVSK